MQSSWGALEAIEANEKIARWHILCLRELQENSGNQMDMHVDAAELGRCFTTLRQLYTDQRELGSACPNEAEFRAYMLIFDLTQKSTAILTGELPENIADDPLVKAAWDIRAAAQRNFDTQKEGSKQNSELGRNMLTRFAALLAQPDLPFLLSALVEVRLREMRRSELRALRGVYPPFKGDKVVYDERGGIKERRMMDMDLLDKLLGCEEQETEEPAYDDVEPVQRDPDTEARDVAQTFGVEMYEEGGRVTGAVINKASSFNGVSKELLRVERSLLQTTSMRHSLDAGKQSPTSGAASPLSTLSTVRPACTLVAAFLDRSLVQPPRLPAMSDWAYIVRRPLCRLRNLRLSLLRHSSQHSTMRRPRHRFPQHQRQPSQGHSLSPLPPPLPRRLLSLLPPRQFLQSLYFHSRSRLHRRRPAQSLPHRHLHSRSPRQKLRLPLRPHLHRCSHLARLPPLLLQPPRRNRSSLLARARNHLLRRHRPLQPRQSWQRHSHHLQPPSSLRQCRQQYRRFPPFRRRLRDWSSREKSGSVDKPLSRPCSTSSSPA